MLVCPYLEKGLLHLDTTVLSPTAKKPTIRDALAGLADLHDKNIHPHRSVPVWKLNSIV
jgi:hypothetical protein